MDPLLEEYCKHDKHKCSILNKTDCINTGNVWLPNDIDGLPNGEPSDILSPEKNGICCVRRICDDVMDLTTNVKTRKKFCKQLGGACNWDDNGLTPTCKTCQNN